MTYTNDTLSRETVVALLNYDGMIRAKGLDQVALDPHSETVVFGDGGYHFESLLSEDDGWFEEEELLRWEHEGCTCR